MKIQNKSKNTIDIREKVMFLLASVYYNRDSILWTDLKEMSLYLFQNWKVGPKGTKELSLFMYRLYIMLRERSLKVPSKFYIDKNPITLMQIDGYGHEQFYEQYAQTSNKMKSCIKNQSLIDEFILESAKDMYAVILNLLKNNEFDEDVKMLVNQELSSFRIYIKHGEAVDIFHKYNDLKLLIEQNCYIKEEKQKSCKEKAERLNTFFNENNKDAFENGAEKATFVLEQLKILLSNTTNPEKKQYIEECIFNLEVSIIASTPQTFEQDVRNGEELLRRFTIN